MRYENESPHGAGYDRTPVNESSDDQNGLNSLIADLDAVLRNRRLDHFWKELSNGVELAARFNVAVDLMKNAKDGKDRSFAAGKAGRLKELIFDYNKVNVPLANKEVVLIEFNQLIDEILTKMGDVDTIEKFRRN